jgi:hypothetical protein
VQMYRNRLTPVRFRRADLLEYQAGCADRSVSLTVGGDFGYIDSWRGGA